MTDLLTMAREHDLPPRWDGLLVTWLGWEDEPGVVLLCPPPKDTSCEGCGSEARQQRNRGLVARSARVTREQLDADHANRARLGVNAWRGGPRLDYVRLSVTRCPDCLLDTAVDFETQEVWTLDHTDYGDTGSVEPAETGHKHGPPPKREAVGPQAQPGGRSGDRTRRQQGVVQSCAHGEPRGPRYCALCRRQASTPAPTPGWAPRTCQKPMERRDGLCGVRATGWAKSGDPVDVAWCGQHRQWARDEMVAAAAAATPTGRPTLTVITGGKA